VKVTASIGVSFWAAGDPVEPEDLVRRADSAMYSVKRQGSASYAVFESFDAAASRRLHVFDLLSRAVVEGRVVVHYQPIVRVHDRSIVGVEALLRLRDDDGVLLYPYEFLDRGAAPIDVEQEVMRQACVEVTRWVERGHDLRLSVNVSAQHLVDIEAFTSRVDTILAATGLPPDRLVVELTEHALLPTNAPTLRGIGDLVDAGIRFSIDDFGTGYGSLTYVAVMPVHELKIDSSFIAGPLPSREATAIMRSVVSLARELDLSCVAEGVENEEHHDRVHAAGVPLAQGLYYSSPLEPKNLDQLLDVASTNHGSPPLPAR